ncbi:fimbrial biogenesis chaperone [Achromobacter sp.]|uniref:fimbrial biogenesis chaperone n=1 Tax=Achromobacter sp. TaxID=134375 RepID=UPI002F95C1E7
MFFRFKWHAAFAALSVAVMATSANAAVVLSGTRVIYSSSQREVTLKLTNEGDGPVLVQSWIDDGDPNATPDQVKVPFTLTPPLFRLDPAKGQTLRIIHTQEPLPQDRESLFWLNALEVPPRAGFEANRLQIAIRSRIKLFFRPAGLPGKAGDAPDKLRWRFVRKPNGGYVLSASNPSGYYVTLSRVSVQAAGKQHVNEEGAMVAPHAATEFDFGSLTAVDSEIPSVVRYTTINDYGAAVSGEFHAGSQSAQ